MKFSDQLKDALARAKAAAGSSWTSERWAEVVDEAFAVAKPAPKPKKKAVSKMTDEEWLQHLEADPVFKGVDIRRELGRCQFWCNEHDKKCSRQRFGNWLLKCDRVVGVDGEGKTSRNRVDPNPKVEPVGWHFVAVKLYGQFAADKWKSDGWAAVELFYRLGIIKAML